MSAVELPTVEVVGDRTVFVIPLGFRDAKPRRHVCSICRRQSTRIGQKPLPGWAIYEDDVVCVDVGGGGERKRSGDRRLPRTR
jgi:hypothetical protein